MNAKQLKVGDLLIIKTSKMTLPPVEITRIDEGVAVNNSNIYYFGNEGWGIFEDMLQERLDKGSITKM